MKWIGGARRAGAIDARWLFLGVALLLIFLLPVPADPLRVELGRAGLAPGFDHLLGTDRLGRDVLSRWLVGGRLSIAVASAVALLACGLGTCFGALAGYQPGPVGALVDRLIDVSLALPVFFVAIAVQAALPPGAAGMVLVLAATGWMGPARIVRGEVLRIRRLAFVEAARALGCPSWRILGRHILPGCAGAIAATLTVSFGDALLIQSTLSFLGLGIPPPAPTWGGMLLDALPEMLHDAWWLILVPGISILGATVGVGALAGGLTASPLRARSGPRRSP